MDYDFEINKAQLDLFFATSYGERTVAPLLEHFITFDDETGKYFLDSESKTQVSNAVLAYYKMNWDKLKEVMKLEYDPIHNFSDEVTEKITDNENKKLNIESSNTETIDTTLTRTDNLNSSEQRNLSGSQNEDMNYQMQGFNSSSYQNKDKEVLSRTTSDTGSVTNTNTGTQENKKSGTNVIAENGEHTEENSNIRERNLSRIGNIGNITTQKMIGEEIELWKWNFMNRVLDDVKKLLTLSVYSS